MSSDRRQWYEEEFETGKPGSDLLKAAFNQASDIRKFEIDLYWKRATYFWTLIAVAFAGYFAILAADSSKMPDKFLLSLVVVCIGIVFTWAWHLANQGSKHWQENWERHLDLLENNVTGPLHKTLLVSDGSSKISVSKINQWASIFVVVIWLLLGVYSIIGVIYSSINSPSTTTTPTDLPSILPPGWSFGISIAVVVITLVFCFLMRLCSKSQSHEEKQKLKVKYRETEIE